MKWIDLEREFEQVVSKLLPKQALNYKFLLAVSGGLDSMVLWHLFQKAGFDIEIAHCNFGLRGQESDEDEKFILEHAVSNHTICSVKHFTLGKNSIKNKSTQMAARDLRYKWFEELVQSKNIHYLVTAHHADDNLETILFNLTRGTGIKGLTGIPEIENDIFRPLLNFNKTQLIDFARKNNIMFREDSSNHSVKYKRNQLRLEIIPKLKEINPSLTETVLDHLPLYKDLKEMLLKQTEWFKNKHCLQKGNLFIIDHKKLLSIPGKLNILNELISGFGFSYKQSLFLIEGRLTQTGTKVESSTHTLYLHNNHWVIAPIMLKFEPIVLDNIPTSLNTQYGNFIFKHTKALIKPETKTLIVLDLKRIMLPLIIRTRNDGDWFCPVGMEGKKQKLKDYFNNEKYSIPEKDSQLLLCAGQDILWIVGKRYDHRYMPLAQDGGDFLVITFIENC